MTVSFQLGSASVKMNQHGKYLGQMSFYFKSYCPGTQADTRRLVAIPGPQFSQ